MIVPVPIAAKIDKLLWYRLRYTVSQSGSPNSITNTVAISEIMPEIFELQVTAPGNVFAGMNLRAHVLAIHPYTKKPIGNVDVSGKLQLELDTDNDEDELNIAVRGRTNAEGIATLEFKIPAGTKLDYDADLTIEGSKSGITRTAEADLEIARDAFVYLYTDKPIYQPDQKLYIRGLYLNNARRPLAEKELEIEIRDEEGESVLEKTVTTSRFGIASIEWRIPADFKLGTYRITVENDDSDEIGKTEFKVSRYDLPNFVVNAKPANSYYLSNETVAGVTVDASYLFGKPVQNGKVKIVEERERTWNFAEQKYDVEQGAVYEGNTDDNGRFATQINIAEAAAKLRKDEWKRFADVRFAAYFTDVTTNRTEQRRFDIRISKEPIHIYFMRPAADPNPAIPFQFYVSAFYADGAPAKTKLTVSGYYDNATANEVLAVGKTNSYGAAKFEFTFPQKPFSEAKNEFNFRITATDKDGNVGTFDENVYVNPDSRQIRVKTDKSIYAPDQPILVKVLSTEKGPVFVDVAKNSSVIWSKQVSLSDGVGTVVIPYRPDFKGELNITAYFYDGDDDNRYSLWNKTVVYPFPTELNLNLKAVKSVYRPGEDARLTFAVKNEEGIGAESALGIVMLDKAIEERARTEQLPDNMADLRKLLGTADRFGDLTRKDLDKIDIAKPISTELQLAAEYLLANKFERPNSFESDSYVDDFGSIYRSLMRRRLEPLFDALRTRHQETGEYPGDAAKLAEFAMQAGQDLTLVRDAWNTPFYMVFRKDRGDVVMEIRSASADKKTGTSDDFQAGEVRFQWFASVMRRITTSLSIDLPGGPKPKTAEEVLVLIKKAGIDLDAVRDPWDRPVRLVTQNYTRGSLKSYLETVGNLDGARQEVMRTKAVEQEIALHSFMSSGQDGIAGNGDDYSLASFVTVLSERDMGATGGRISLSKTTTSKNRGAIGGTITDPNGAVVPGTRIKATNASSNELFETESNAEGLFLVVNLPSGKYEVRAEAPGFRNSVITDIVVSSYNLVNIDITLEVGHVESVVEVTAGASATMNTQNSAVSTNVTRSEAKSISGVLGNGPAAVQSFTPRIREYFPETLVWQPDLITGKNGRASFNFKMADSLTTWKLYAFGSTESGEFGFVEREIQTFQPFFAELDPPKILTEGDEISLPVPVRNYTDKTRRVSVSMEPNSWSRLPNPAARQIDILPNSSRNAVFQFVAAMPVKEGKQRVSALAGSEGDAVEKPVTVKPNGREVVITRSDTFQGSSAFDLNFPADAFAANRTATLKIYPNMLAHVAESVEGLLQRPHGCGEQTTSSTYPNLMILKLEKEFGKPINAKIKTQAQTYLAEGYKRLLNYRTPSGGFSYWGANDTPNPALTAYIIRFLTDAEEFIDVDQFTKKQAESWLASQQRPDGSWNYSGGPPDAVTAYIARSLLHGDGKDAENLKRVNAGLGFLEKGLDKTADAYVIANTALIAAKVNNKELAERSFRLLAEKAQIGNDGTSWPAASTPFYGWGLTAEIETTAIAVEAFKELEARSTDTSVPETLNARSLAAGGLRFLLAKKDKYGVWHSTQTTVNVLNTIIAIQKRLSVSADPGEQKITVLVNGITVKEIAVSPSAFNEPVRIELGPLLTQNSNRIEIKGAGLVGVAGTQLVVSHYEAWANDATDHRYFDLKVAYDKTSARIGEDISCSVDMRRKGYSGNGMVLTEIGLPPGADVDRTALESAKAKGDFSRYDILPDKVLIYSWNASGPLSFSFKFKVRYGINAQTAPSLVYDYYNPEAQATVAPLRFSVK